MRAIETPALTHIARAFDIAGRPLGRIVTIAAVAVILALTRRRRALLAFAIAEAVALSASAGLKVLVGRPRPPHELAHAAGSSFPSGHTTFAAVMCASLVLLFAHRRRWWALALLGIAGMAWSRTYLQVHWLSDVFGGALLGVGVALVSFGAVSGRRTAEAARPPRP
jgi:undecaprenyl-diphosphatase